MLKTDFSNVHEWNETQPYYSAGGFPKPTCEKKLIYLRASTPRFFHASRHSAFPQNCKENFFFAQSLLKMAIKILQGVSPRDYYELNA